MIKKTYVIADRAGEWVAGFKRPPSGEITLTERQAAHGVRIGLLKEKPLPAKPKRRRRQK